MARASGFRSGELTDTAVQVLMALVTPRHGYAAMQYLSEVSNGEIEIGPASLYTTLKKFLENGFIEEIDSGESKRTYRLTSVGHDILIRNIDHRQRLLDVAKHIMEEQ